LERDIVKKLAHPESLLTLPLVLGVLVVIGGVSALVISGLFVFQAHRVNVETHRIQAALQAERDETEAAERSDEATVEARWEEIADQPPELNALLVSHDAEDAVPVGEPVTALKPGVRLQAQRPAHWDQAEIIDILEDSKIKVRWLSGEPGEAVIAAELVRSDLAPTP
jgi:hypothetical protein